MMFLLMPRSRSRRQAKRYARPSDGGTAMDRRAASTPFRPHSNAAGSSRNWVGSNDLTEFVLIQCVKCVT
jgi:hypothetical protein